MTTTATAVAGEDRSMDPHTPIKTPLSRRFGTVLSVNSPPRSSVKKVRIRRPPSSKKKRKKPTALDDSRSSPRTKTATTPTKQTVVVSRGKAKENSVNALLLDEKKEANSPTEVTKEENRHQEAHPSSLPGKVVKHAGAVQDEPPVDASNASTTHDVATQVTPGLRSPPPSLLHPSLSDNLTMSILDQSKDISLNTPMETTRDAIAIDFMSSQKKKQRWNVSPLLELHRGSDRLKGGGGGSAIKEMAIRMRAEALEEELVRVRAAKNCHKQHARLLEMRLQNEAEERQRLIREVKDKTQALDRAKLESELTKKELGQQVGRLLLENSELSEQVHKSATELSRSIATQQQTEVRVQQLEQSKKLLEHEVKAARNQLRESSEEHQRNDDSLYASIREKDSEVKELKLQLVTAQASVSSLTTDLSHTKADLNKATEALELADAEKKTLAGEVARLNPLLEEAKAEKTRMQQELATTTNKLAEVVRTGNEQLKAFKELAADREEQMEKDLASKEAAVAEFMRTVDRLTAQEKTLTKKVDTLRHEVTNFSEKESRLCVELERTKNELSGVKSSAKKQLKELFCKVEKLQNELKESREVLEQRNADFATACEDVEMKTAENDALSSKLQKVESELDEAKKQIHDARTQISLLKESSAAKQEELAMKLQMLLQTSATVESLKGEKDALFQEVQELCELVDRLQHECAEANEEQTKLAWQLDMARAALDKSRSVACSRERELLVKIDKLELKLKDGQTRFVRKENDLATAIAELEIANAEVDELNLTLEQHKSALVSARTEAKDGKEQVHALEEAAAQSLDTISSLRDAVEKAKEAESSLTADLDKARNELVDSQTVATVREKELLLTIDLLEGKLNERENCVTQKNADLAAVLDKLKSAHEKNRELNIALDDADLRLKSASEAIKTEKEQMDLLQRSTVKERQQLENQIVQSEKSLQDSLETIRMLSSEKQVLTEQLTQVRSTAGQFTEEATALKADLDKARTELRESRAASKVEEERFISHVDSVQAQLEECVGQIKQKDYDLASSVAKFEAAESEIKQLTSDLLQSKTQLDSATSKLAVAAAQMEDLKIEIRLKEELLSESSERVARLEEEKEQLLEQVTELQEEESASRELCFELRVELEEVKTKLAEFRATTSMVEGEMLKKIDLLKVDLADKQHLVDKKQSDLNVARIKWNSAISKNEELSSGLQQAQGDLEAAMRTISSLEHEMEEASHRGALALAKAKEKADAEILKASVATEAKLTELRSEVSDLKTEVRSLESSKMSAAREIKSLRNAKAERATRVQQLTKILEEKEDQLQAKKLELKDAEVVLEELKSELELKLEELKFSEISLARAQTELSELTFRLSSISYQSSKEKDSMATEISSLREEYNVLISCNADLESSLTTMRSKVSDAESQLFKTREELKAEQETSRQLKATAIESQKAFESIIESLASESDAHHEASIRFKQECEDLRLKVEVLESEVVALRKEIAESRALIETKHDSQATREKELTVQLSDEQKKVSDLANRVAAMEVEKERVAKEAEALRQNLEEDVRLARYEADLKSKRLTELVEERASDLKDYNQCREELKNASTEIERVRDSLKRSREEVEHFSSLSDQVLREKHDALEALTRSHSSDLRKSNDEKEALESALRQANDQKNKIEARLNAAQRSIKASEIERDQLSAEKESLSSALLQAQDSLADLQSEFENLREEDQNSSVDSLDSQFDGLSRSDLKRKCRDLKKELSLAERCASEASNDAAGRTARVERLSSDLNSMSNEIDKLLAANEMLEKSLKTARVEKETFATKAASSQSKIKLLEKETKLMKEDLARRVEQNRCLSSELETLERNMKGLERDHLLRRTESETELEQCRKKITGLEDDKESAAKALAQKQQELQSMTQEHLALKKQVELLQAQASDLQAQLFAARNKLGEMKHLAQSDNDRYKQRIVSLEDTCSGLREKVADLELEVETKTGELQEKQEAICTLTEHLENQRNDVATAEGSREQIVSKLTEASRVIATQKDSIKMLENRASSAEQNAAALADKVQMLQLSIQKLESSSEVNAEAHQMQQRELENKCAKLDEDRNILRTDSSNLREQLRQVRRQASDYQKTIEKFESRCEALKDAHDQSKMQLLEARKAEEEARQSSKTLERELESKKMEVDHFKAKVQVLSGTIARMKADFLLLQEAALQSEFKVSAAENKCEEFSKLKSELQYKSSKLQSLADVYRSQRQVLALSQSSEGKLFGFVEELLQRTAVAWKKVATQSKHLQELGNYIALNGNVAALDLAGLETHERTVTDFRSSLEELSSLVPVVVSELEDKRAQVQVWKEKRTFRMLSKPVTPDAKNQRMIPDSPAILEAMEKMKKILNNEVLSPNKKGVADGVDGEYLQHAVQTMERQIDCLLVDLKCANEALQAKDQLFTDLEELVSKHETERDVLGRKLEAMQARNLDLEDRLQKELVCKKASLNEVSKVHQEVQTSTSPPCDESSITTSKLAGGRLVVNFLERRSHVAKAAVFRQWSCQTSAIRAVSKQGEAAAALAHELEETREKLVILKKHLKKTRRGPRDYVYGLDRIVEAPETTRK